MASQLSLLIVSACRPVSDKRFDSRVIQSQSEAQPITSTACYQWLGTSQAPASVLAATRTKRGSPYFVGYRWQIPRSDSIRNNPVHIRDASGQCMTPACTRGRTDDRRPGRDGDVWAGGQDDRMEGWCQAGRGFPRFRVLGHHPVSRVTTSFASAHNER